MDNNVIKLEKQWKKLLNRKVRGNIVKKYKNTKKCVDKTEVRTYNKDIPKKKEIKTKNTKESEV